MARRENGNEIELIKLNMLIIRRFALMHSMDHGKFNKTKLILILEKLSSLMLYYIGGQCRTHSVFFVSNLYVVILLIEIMYVGSRISKLSSKTLRLLFPNRLIISAKSVLVL